MIKSRPPVVTVLGHVDHGKTTLLDALRQTHVASREVGGITQAIGASQITTKDGKKITFIDTPGHAIFAKMRQRGAKVADIAVLVVAADDGVMPQTIEAIKYIKETKVPFVVAITKTDLPAARVESVIGQLEKEGVLFEGRGGNVPKILVSVPKKEGLEELLEIILLLAEMEGVKGNPEGDLEAIVVETAKEKGGTLVSAVIKEGTLKTSDELQTESQVVRVKGLFDQNKKRIKKALPGEACLILGFKISPEVGSFLRAKSKIALKAKKTKVVLKSRKEQVPIVIKAQNLGALEAVLANIPDNFFVISAEAGDISEGDVFAAKTSGAEYIFAFNASLPKGVQKLAETEGIKIENYKIIYELITRLKELVEEAKEKVFGKAQIVKSFPFDGKKVAGCKVIKGEIRKGNKLVLVRDEKEIGRVRILSMKKQKEEIVGAKEGEEFGVVFEPQLDFAKGDMLLSVK